MALPASLRTSVIPAELELIASEHLVEIVPLVAMERTAFISVRLLDFDEHIQHVLLTLPVYFVGSIWPITSPSKMQSAHMDGHELENEEEMSHCTTALA